MMNRLSFSAAASQGAVNKVSSQTGAVAQSFERLSSGLRINRAADDAAGSAVATSLSAQVRGLAQANANAQDAVNLLQTADGGLTETAAVLQRMRELVVQAGNDTYTQADRAKIQTEIEQLKETLTSLAHNTQFNGRKLLDGSIAASRFAEPNGAYITGNPTVGLPGDQGAWIRGVDIYAQGEQDVQFTIDILDPGLPSLPGSPYPAVTAHIRDSSGYTTTYFGYYNDAIPGQGVPTDFSGGMLPISGWGVGIYWSPHILYPTVDAGKSFTMFLDHTLSVVTVDRSLEMHTGANAGQTMNIALRSVTAEDLRLESLTVLGTTEAASHVRVDKSLRSIDLALARVNEERSRVGAWQNQLGHTMLNTSQAGENLSVSRSDLMDADYAKESTQLTRQQVLQNASISLVAQTNIVPEMALKLLKGED
jgi:flagellin